MVSEAVDNLIAHILLVEDDPDDASFVKRAFSRVWIDHKLHVVGDGEEALKFLRNEPGFERVPRPDLVLLDLNLPKMNGFEVLDVMKADKDLRRIPVVVLTTTSDEKARIRSYSAHANSFITKPIGAEQLNRMVEMVVQYWFSTVGLPGDGDRQG